MASQIFTSSPSLRTSRNHEKITDTYTKLCSNSNCLVNTDTFSPFTTSPFWQWTPKINTQLLHFKKNNTLHTIISRTFNHTLYSEYQDFNYIYTDASKTSDGEDSLTVLTILQNSSNSSRKPASSQRKPRRSKKHYYSQYNVHK
ncbi:unnamed protein product [Macrosiphum euphorbiae]|uniref:Uncharacterized protein n=1 Tax=Macrosiphum euphorbiae TaxID=13131 RepID=A0AAV0Y589_9HEMI|nr:unnamed protein product [Macrosiphum euphorbiae]